MGYKGGLKERDFCPGAREWGKDQILQRVVSTFFGLRIFRVNLGGKEGDFDHLEIF